MNPAVEDDLAAALDEVRALRCILAYEAQALEATLDYKTFPKSRRGVTQNQVARMQIVAEGHTSAQNVVERYPAGSLRGIRRTIGQAVHGNWRNGWRTIEEEGEDHG